MIGAEDYIEVAAESLDMLEPEVGLQAARGGVAFLAIDKDVAQIAVRAFHGFSRPHKHPPRSYV